MSSYHSLAKQKRRLSLLFSLSIFSIIIFLGVGFLSFKYFNYERQELLRLSIQSQSIVKTIQENPLIQREILEGKGLVIPSSGMRRNGMGNFRGTRPEERRIMQTENFFLYQKTSGDILFSVRKDNELHEFILQEIQSKTREGKTTFTLNDSIYFFLDTPIGENLGAVFFTESRMTPKGFLTDILLYLMGTILLSFGIYLISFRFVNNTLSPVEKNMDDMEQFIHNAGHELKTPVSVIKSSLELMRLKKNYDEGITESIQELDRMNGLIQALISLSVIEENENFESIDIGETCEKFQKYYQEKLDEKQISMKIISKKPLHM